MIHRIRRFLALPAERRRLLVEAAAALALARLATAALPFRLVVRLFGLRLSSLGCPAGGGAENAAAQRVGSVVDRVAERLPFTVVCLPRALAAAWMLKRRGIASHVVFGVRLAGGVVKAHAWTVTGDGVAVVGFPVPADFAPVAVYAT